MGKRDLLTSTHWGTYRVDVADGRVTGLRGFEHDPDPSPIGSGHNRCFGRAQTDYGTDDPQGLAEAWSGYGRARFGRFHGSLLEGGEPSGGRGVEQGAPRPWQPGDLCGVIWLGPVPGDFTMRKANSNGF